ncbi:MAG: AAA family ATPase [Candidatus Woesearchaeota archaeon]
MRIKGIALDNIRSYVQQEIKFPEGSVLLSGNIGSGKSTILLAMEFALFGLMRGTLSGAALLRNGTDRGSVRLDFSVEEKEITIYRSLKRTKASVTQDAGWVEINGVRKEATAVELKQKVLELLNYPLDLLTKSKSLVFRYTVYTPQEEMKHILFCDQEERLDILRKVFGVEKYKRITSNTQLIASKLRENMREIAGYIADLENKRENRNSKADEVKEHESKLKRMLGPLKKASEKALEAKSTLAEIESRMKEVNSLQQELTGRKVELEHAIRERKRLKEESEALEKEVKGMEGLKAEELMPQIEKKKLAITAAENLLRKIVRDVQELKVKIRISKDIVDKVNKLSKCPTCLQDVPDSHKTGIKDKEKQKIGSLSSEFEKGVKEEIAKGQEIERLKSEMDELIALEKEAAIIRQMMREVEEKKKRLSSASKQLSETKSLIGTLNSAIEDLYKRIEPFAKVDEEYATAKEDYEAVADDKNKLEVEKARVEATVSAVKSELKGIDHEIKEKEGKRDELNKLSGLQDWLVKDFVSLVSAMEKSIMFKVHESFNSLFERWFGILVEGDVINVSLDEFFTPRIGQNGYDIEYDFLSGGEKTAVALAYRLALNQVINNLMSGINTRDLIILDEPTDGFSSEQLDRMKMLLEELEVGQMVIVSHEPKVESFVDTVIRFEKAEHVSRAFS